MIREKLTGWLHREKEKLTPMTAKEKREYIWDYYRWWIIGGVLLLAISLSAVQNARYQQRKVLISGMFINTSVSAEGYDFVSDGYWAYCGADKATRAELVEAAWISYDPAQRTSTDINAQMAADAMIAVGDLDYIICDSSTADYFDQLDYCVELSGRLCAGEWTFLQTEGSLTAIDLTGSRLEQEYGLSAEPSYILFMRTAPDWTRCEAFLNYLFGK